MPSSCRSAARLIASSVFGDRFSTIQSRCLNRSRTRSPIAVRRPNIVPRLAANDGLGTLARRRAYRLQRAQEDRMRRLLAIGCCGLGVAVPATAARAAGGPVPPVVGAAGVSAPGGGFNYITVL